MKITKYQQSAFFIEINNKRILIDPGEYCYDGNFSPENWKNIDILLLTHGHSDHCMPEAVKIIYKNNKPIIIGSKWVKEKINDENIPVKIFNVGQSEQIDDIIITAVNAIHGLHPKRESDPKETIGFLIKGEISFYHCSDTLYFTDKPFADVVAVPISNDYVTMGPKEAAVFVKEIKPKLAIPMHYDGQYHPMDPNKFTEEMKGSDIEVKILDSGESVEINL